MKAFRGIRGRSDGLIRQALGDLVASEGVATNPITSRETPAQGARTSFRHPQDVLRDAGITRSS